VDAIDLRGFHAINGVYHSPWLDFLSTIFSYSGLGQVQALGIILFCLLRDCKKYIAPLLLAEVISGFLIGDALKWLLDRDRPSNLPGVRVMENLHAHSFPSGHTTTSFALAFMLFLLIPGSRGRKLGWVALVWASFVGWSRIYRGVHWPSDVLGGLFVGMVGAAIAYAISIRLNWFPRTPDQA
jgi:undecaprenyl-diphosphatase